ncbi:lipid phosphate phosphatase 2-like isoform X2 [Momordica charantia]|uniref:Lipid phosphate phosphatase 2-like isoform X2 n=2 Tax=Momordica charantia TaxID=3673 RepID=A0A6J1BXP3_MOMCH|nr:lipid phosphate phosphatase 2-like isoform X2 [Momordica charantia]
MPWRNVGSLSCFRIFGVAFQVVSQTGPQLSSVTSDCLLPINFPLIDHQNQEDQKDSRMREVQLGSHTLRSHGVAVARIHMHDWCIVLLLVLTEIILNTIHPFYRFVGKDMMTDLRFPFKENTVPIWAVPIYAGLLPIVIFLFIYWRRRDVYDLHHAILGLLYSLLITGVITDAIKVAVGRPRPNFFWRCFPDGKDVYDALGDVICHGDASVIKEGHKSFPSGHTSWSFAGLGFLSLYLSGKIQVFDQRGHIAKLCIVFLPLLFAALVGVSRVDDYWHHWQDVFAGGLLGLVVSTFCYLQFFPPPYHSQGWGPYAYFRVLESLANPPPQPANAANVRNEQDVERQTENDEDDRRSNGRFIGLSTDTNSRSTMEETETERK